MSHRFQKVFSLVCALIVSSNLFVVPGFASYADRPHSQVLDDYGALGYFASWIVGTKAFGYTSYSDNSYAANQPQKYYTTPTSSVQDKYGNVTNYYRGGDTTTTNNVTTNNTYSANFKSWYYDNTTNNYNYNEFNKYDTTNNYLYYNQDNSRYYISIDNSTDEYYLIDVQYSPTFVTVNYTYNTTNNNYADKVGDVTNVYYFELKDGRNSSSLTAAEVAGMDTAYDVANYELVADDPNTLSLQHFDGNYTDSSSYNRSFYSQNRSTNYVDSGAFGQAVSLPNGSAAGVTIPNLSSYNSLSFDFRIYYNDISKLGIYFGDTNIFQEVPTLRKWIGKDIYDDDGKALTQNYVTVTGISNPSSNLIWSSSQFVVGDYYSFSDIASSLYMSSNNVSHSLNPLSNTLSSSMNAPVSASSSGYVEDSSDKKFGWVSFLNEAVYTIF